MVTEAQKKASAKYHKEHLKVINVRFNKTTDADIIEYLDMIDNRQGYIKELIRKDMGVK